MPRVTVSSLLRTKTPRRRVKRTAPVSLSARRTGLMKSILRSNVHRFVRNSLSPSFNVVNITEGSGAGGQKTWTVAANTSGLAAIRAQLADTVGNGELTSLFDLYKIKCVVYRIALRSNLADIANATTSAMPYISYSYDYDDDIAATEAAIAEYGTARTRYFDAGRRAVTIKVRPRINILANDGAASVGVQTNANRQPWIDAAAPAFRHFGLKIAVNNPNAAGSLVFDVTAKYYILCKTVR